MTNVEKLQNKLDEMKRGGLNTVSLYPGDVREATVESIAGEMLQMIEAIEGGKGRALKFNDSKRKVSDAVSKVLRGKGQSKAVKTKRGSALTQP